MPAVVAIVPARGGSKGVPGKNSKLLAGIPLMAYSIVAGLRCPAIDRVIVSTDSPELAELGRHWGAEVPFLRPAELAADRSPDRDYIVHCLQWLEANEGLVPDQVVQLRPTTPLRDPELIARAIAELAADDDATSLRSAHALAEPPQKMLGIENGRFSGLFPHDPRPEYFNLPRQTFPTAYSPNGYVDIVKPSFLLTSDVIYGPRIRPFITPLVTEVDTAQDFELLEFLTGRSEHVITRLLREAPPS